MTKTEGSALVHRNKRIRELLDQWMSEPDDLGAEWWTEFDREIDEERSKASDE